MDQQSTVRELEDRARRAFTSMRAVCLRAGISQSTFTRWKETPGNPHPTSATLSTLQKLTNALDEIERENRRKYGARDNAARKSKAAAA